MSYFRSSASKLKVVDVPLPPLLLRSFMNCVTLMSDSFFVVSRPLRYYSNKSDFSPSYAGRAKSLIGDMPRPGFTLLFSFMASILSMKSIVFVSDFTAETSVGLMENLFSSRRGILGEIGFLRLYGLA